MARALPALFLLLVLGGGPSPAADAGFASVPRLFGTFSPEVGAWSEYLVTEKGSGDRVKMRMAVVGEADGAHWYEVLHDDGQNRNIVKMLVRGDPNDPENIERMIIKSGQEPAIEMPAEFVAMGRRMAVQMFEERSGVSTSPAGLRVEKGHEVSVRVPAGEFRATLHRILGAGGELLATYHFNPDVLPLGVVTSETDETSMVLLSHGRDATSSIREEPIPMTAPPGMPKGMPRGLPPGLKRPAAE